MTRRRQPVPDPDDAGQYLPNGAAAKSGLNQAILSKGWYRFEQALKSVSRYTGTQVVKVAGSVHIATLLGVWACGPEIP